MSDEPDPPNAPDPDAATADATPVKARPPLSASPPIPQPGPPVEEREQMSPTRYGDWEKGGIAWDF